MQKLLTFFSKNISLYAIFNDQNVNDTLTKDIVSLNNWSPTIYCSRSLTETMVFLFVQVKMFILTPDPICPSTNNNYILNEKKKQQQHCFNIGSEKA